MSPIIFFVSKDSREIIVDAVTKKELTRLLFVYYYFFFTGISTFLLTFTDPETRNSTNISSLSRERIAEHQSVDGSACNAI